MNSLIEYLKRNTEKRKKIKNRIDSELSLSTDAEPAKLTVAAYGDNKNRLLDEGAIIEGDGSVFAYIKKGTIEKFMSRNNVYLDNLPEDYVGNINIGHMSHAQFPFPVGEWTMANMSMVDIGDGRKGIDVDVTVDEESPFIKELERLGHEISMSVEMLTHTDWEATEDLGMWVIDEILIQAYAIVGDGKNVNSNGWKLKGEYDMTKKQLEELKAETVSEVDSEVTEDTAKAELTAEETETEETAETEETETEETVEAEAEEETTEEEVELEAEAETEEETAELSVGEEVESEEEAEDLEEAEDEEATFEDIEAFVNSLQSEICELRNENAELKKTNKRLNKKLKAELASKAQFASKFKVLAEATGVEETPKENVAKNDYIFGDGIGE